MVVKNIIKAVSPTLGTGPETVRHGNVIIFNNILSRCIYIYICSSPTNKLQVRRSYVLALGAYPGHSLYCLYPPPPGPAWPGGNILLLLFSTRTEYQWAACLAPPLCIFLCLSCHSSSSPDLHVLFMNILFHLVGAPILYIFLCLSCH